MSHKKHQVWAMMPLLGILLMSPQDVSHKYGRGIASDTDPAAAAPATEVAAPASVTPKFDALLGSVTVPSRQNPVNLNGDLLKEEISSLLSRISTAEEFDKNTVLKPALDHLRDEIKASVIQLKQVENSLPDLINHDEEGDLKSRIGEAKIRIEASLKDLEEDEVKLAARPAATPPATPATEVVVAPPATPATTPAVTPAATPERAPSVVVEETKPETKPDEAKKPEKDPILCALEEQNKLLQTTLQTFMQQQMTIMQQMMSMQQQMMMQNMYKTPDSFNYQNAYQYQPQVAGNWVYYPNGLQPIQPGQAQGQMQNNIFGLNQQQPGQPQQPVGPMMPQMQQAYNPMNSMMYGLQQPGMMNQGGQWNLQPQMPMELIPPMLHQPGSFGMNSVGVNMSSPASGFGQGFQSI